MLESSLSSYLGANASLAHLVRPALGDADADAKQFSQRVFIRCADTNAAITINFIGFFVCLA